MGVNNSQRSTLFMVAGLLAIALLAACIIAVYLDSLLPSLTQLPTASDSTGLEVAPRKGKIAPDFTLVDLDGNEVSLSDFRGQPVLINFWATWCPPCRTEMPDIAAAYEEHRDKELVVLAVNVEESADNVRGFADEDKVSFPVLLDGDGAVARQYRVRALPTSFFINRDGVIADVFYGGMSRKKLDGFLDKILNIESP
jgi:peroxiredoxin